MLAYRTLPPHRHQFKAFYHGFPTTGLPIPVEPARDCTSTRPHNWRCTSGICIDSNPATTVVLAPVSCIAESSTRLGRFDIMVRFTHYHRRHLLGFHGRRDATRSSQMGRRRLRTGLHDTSARRIQPRRSLMDPVWHSGLRSDRAHPPGILANATFNSLGACIAAIEGYV